MIRFLLSLSIASFATAAEPKPASRKPVVLTEEAIAIHKDGPVVDGHNDFPWELREKGKSSFLNFDIAKNQPRIHTDIPRLRTGGVGVQFWAAYIPTSFTKKGTVVKATLEQIDVVHRLVKRYPDDFEMAGTVADIERIRKAGKIASLIGVEGGHCIDNSLAALRMYHRLGVRYMTLTHSESTDWADSATDAPKANGLTPFGEEVVREMNALGMLVDLSHVSPDTMKAAIKASKAPVIFSHSSARALADHPRNVPDDVLELVKANRGVVMVNFYSGFITPEGSRATRRIFEIGRELKKKFPDDDAKGEEAIREWLKANEFPRGSVHDVVDHIEHVIKIAGVESVGIGSDFDGITRTPEQLEHVGCYPYITQELLNRGYKKPDILKILGGNALRAMRDAELVAEAMKKK
jgi:membrane dipeptidase